jgi:hypothetical protein
MRKSYLLGVVAAVAAVALPAASAQAAEVGPDVAACTYSGTTSQLTPIPSVPRDLSDGNATDIETGTYIFATAPPFPLPQIGQVSTQCLHVDADTPGGTAADSNNTGLYSAGISASGNYHNILCGTGSTDGSATLAVSGDPEVSGITFNYHIDFAAGQGAAQTVVNANIDPPGMTGLGLGKATNATVNTTNHGSLPATGAGTTHIFGKSPAGTTLCATGDVTDFDVVGDISGVS